MKRRYAYVLVVLLAFLYHRGYAQEKWELRKNEDGIAVYVRQLANQSTKEIKVECELPGTTHLLLSVLKNVEHHPDWVYINRKTKLLKKINENRLIYYTEADMPWPLADRDMVVEALYYPSIKGNQARVEVKSISGYLAEKENFVRIPASVANWEINQLTKNKIKVVYTFSVNPGGSIPSWLVNSTVAMGPIKTFQNLRHLLESKARSK